MGSDEGPRRPVCEWRSVVLFAGTYAQRPWVATVRRRLWLPLQQCETMVLHPTVVKMRSVGKLAKRPAARLPDWPDPPTGREPRRSWTAHLEYPSIDLPHTIYQVTASDTILSSSASTYCFSLALVQSMHMRTYSRSAASTGTPVRLLSQMFSNKRMPKT